MKDVRNLCRTVVKVTNSRKFKSCPYYGWNPVNSYLHVILQTYFLYCATYRVAEAP